MCGICGVIGQAPDKNKRVQAMIRAMHHRGPDDSGIFDSGGVTLGMTRLAIVDLSKSGHQPMSNENQNVFLVYNGEMYNFLEEKIILQKKGYIFRSSSDTEVVLKMYEEYGDDFLLRMRGMFALAIFDRRGGKEKILLARDHLGIKPLLYCLLGSTLIFASEMKAILKSGLIKKEIDPEGLRLLLSYGSLTQPKTIIRDVQMLPPAHRLILTGNKITLKKYWYLAVGRYPELQKQSYTQQKKILLEELTRVVKMQMQSDVPSGAFLSGGVDSSTLVALMSQISRRPIKTFSVGFDKDTGVPDETDEAAKIAHMLGTKHQRVHVSAREVKTDIRKIIVALDQPSVDGVNSFFVSKATKDFVKVAISGTGGDELFAGYPWFANMVSLAKHHSSLNFFHKLKMRDNFLAHFSQQHQIFDIELTKQVLAKSFQDGAKMGQENALDFKIADELSYAQPIERVTALCLRGYTQNQLLRDIDATSMFHSLEVRVPYLDPILTDLVLSLPEKVKLSNIKKSKAVENQTYRQLGAKKILIDIGKNLLPKDMDKQVKRGFTLPFNYWLKGDLKSVLAESLSLKVVKKRGFFNPKVVDFYHQQYVAGHLDWPTVWLLMIIELWSQEVLDK